MKKPKIAISVGDINGVGIEIALKSHKKISKICDPIYFINKKLLKNSAKILNLDIPKNFTIKEVGKDFEIKPGKVCKKSGEFSFISFKEAVKSTKNKKTKAVVTLPINKEAWKKTDINFVGHTDYLAKKFKKNAIMMLGCEKLFVALFSDHIPLKDVSKQIKKEKLKKFLIDFYKSTKFQNIGVLGFNPHASDNGTIGKKEEIEISEAIKLANKKLNKEIFSGPIVPDTAFSKNSLKKCNKIVAMYHDQGLAPLKTLYFDKSINVSLNLPIIRTSVDHGTAFDIAYKNQANTKSYIQAVKFALKCIEKKEKANN